ncbi:MAG: LacI family DNA-binding transcriptional regulator [Bacteroidales bacterium]|nr:LacI family DNA-binding transcriptional regulator [Bacteroidales bacterium]
MDEKKITIFDVAEKAGVSKGTVDRVLHNRGEVSKKSEAKVREAIKLLNYEPNLYASLLATKSKREIALLLPKYNKGEYWEMLYDGFVAGGEAVSSLNISTNVFLYDQYDSASFKTAAERMLESRPSGVVIPPLFKNDTMELVNKLNAMDIPYVYVDTRLEEGNYLAYYGMPMYKSGYLCASLLTDRRREDEVKEIVVVRIQRDKSRLSDPTINRRAGFTDFIETYFPECVIYNLFIDPSDARSTNEALESFHELHPGIKHVVMFNSRVHLLSDFFKRHPDNQRCVIGYDNLDGNVEAVREGLVNLLITQHTDRQSHDAVVTLADYIIMRKQPPIRDCYVHMDILNKYNLENY